MSDVTNGVPVPQPTRHSDKPFGKMPKFYDGPNEIRDVLIEKFGVEWVSSYIDQCDWVDSTRSLLANHSFGYRQITSRASKLLAKMDIKLVDPKTGLGGGDPRHPLDPADAAPSKRKRPDAW